MPLIILLFQDFLKEGKNDSGVDAEHTVVVKMGSFEAWTKGLITEKALLLKPSKETLAQHAAYVAN